MQIQKMLRSTLSFLAISVLVAHTALAQLSPQEAIEGMGRGINLGNTLEPPTEGAWNNGPAQEAHFDAYQEAGFTNVRIPVRWDLHTGNAVPYDIQDSWMDRVEEVVDWALDRGFYVTLNGHHEDWLKNNYDDPNLRARYDSIWVQISERFKDKDERLLMEIINEPNGMNRLQVDDLNARILGIIRENNPTRIVIFGGQGWANSPDLLQAAIPEDDYLIGYYHAYDPWPFSGEGQGTWGTASDYAQLTNKYQSVKSWSEEHGVPVHHSEFGAIHACDYNSRMRIYAHNVEECMVHGFAFSVWDDGGDFGILDRGSHTWPEVKDILIHYHEDSPNQITSELIVDPSDSSQSILVRWNNRHEGDMPIIVERAVGARNQFERIAVLPSTARSFPDLDVSAGQTYTYRVHTMREDSTLLHGYPTRIRILATEQSHFGESPQQIPGKIEVEDYDEGGEGLAYHDNDAINIPGQYRPDEGVDIGGTDGGYTLGYVSQGEWLEYTVDVQISGVYSVRAMVASEQANGRWSVGVGDQGESVSLLVPSTGDWNEYVEVIAAGALSLDAGRQVMRIDILNDVPFNLDVVEIRLENVATEDQAADVLQFELYPNPASAEVQLVRRAEDLGMVDIVLLDAQGKHVRTMNTEGYELQLDISGVEQGLYYVKLQSEQGVGIQSLVIQ